MTSSTLSLALVLSFLSWMAAAQIGQKMKYGDPRVEQLVKEAKLGSWQLRRMGGKYTAGSSAQIAVERALQPSVRVTLLTRMGDPPTGTRHGPVGG